MPKYSCLRCSQPCEDGSQFCTKHSKTTGAKPPKQKRKYWFNKQRQDEDPRNTRRFKKLKESVRSLHPLCAGCLLHDKYEPGSDCDHIWSVRDYHQHLYTLDNLQHLCRSHHSVKTGYEGRGVVLDYKANKAYRVETGEVKPIVRDKPMKDGFMP